MTYKTYKLIPPHGGYKSLESYKTAVIIYDGTVAFCNRYMSYKSHKSYMTKWSKQPDRGNKT